MSRVLATEEKERRHNARVAACHISTFYSALREMLVRAFRDGEIRAPLLGDIVIDDDDALERVLRKLDRLEAAAKRKAYDSGKVTRRTPRRTRHRSSLI